MLLREDERGVLAIGQPAHAALSGQLAQAWGNEQFGAFEPFEEVCLATEQHDVGWSMLDLEPAFNPDTGRPRSFLEMPLAVHLDLWRRGPRSLVSQNRYAALLVSLHGWRLYERRDLERLPRSHADAITRFLEDQRIFQAELLASLRDDAGAAGWADARLVERNSLLLWTWDYLSLALCLSWAPATAKRAPTRNGSIDIEIIAGAGPDVIRLEPWPFASDRVTVRAEGRRLPERFETEAEMRRQFAGAPWETLELRLERA
jgi:Protein of unknown function (DUF3891)